ncbi:hypothetical protein WA026_019320 [Henosepilachna vigintioctopunctata]|uniref:Uncharacterized protein n=1 Tax=Henosepilachna vigintioctopunctata TaxID=420089 RepID=A0AAW1U9S7_9CUCU
MLRVSCYVSCSHETAIEQFPQITASKWTFSAPGHGKDPMDGEFSVEDRDKESLVLLERIYLDIEKNDEFLSYLHMSNKSIYDAVYESDNSDNEKLQKVSNRLHEKNDDYCAVTSYGNDKENFHTNMIRPKIFFLVYVPTENKKKYSFDAVSDTFQNFTHSEITENK